MKLYAYIINLRKAKERRAYISSALNASSIEYQFVNAVDGNKLKSPYKGFCQWAYRLAHGKRTNLAELGCYYSHIKALKLFLKTDQTHALILEDDAELSSDFEEVLTHALSHSNRYDILRLSGLHRGTPLKILELNDKYNLSIFMSRQTGAAAYLVNRRAAERLVNQLIPMWLPFDHAFDREWFIGLKALCIEPLPVLQNRKFDTQIAATKSYKYPSYVRYLSVLPFRTINEISRLIFRFSHFTYQKISKE